MHAIEKKGKSAQQKKHIHAHFSVLFISNTIWRNTPAFILYGGKSPKSTLFFFFIGRFFNLHKRGAGKRSFPVIISERGAEKSRLDEAPFL